MSLVILSSILATLVFGNMIPIDHLCYDEECCVDKCFFSADGPTYYPEAWKCDADGSYVYYDYPSIKDKPTDCNNLGEFQYKEIIDNPKCCSENRRLQENNEFSDDFIAMDPMVMAKINNKMKYTYCVSTKFSLPLGRKFLGLDRSLNLLCKNGWYFKDIGDGEPGEQIFRLYTYTINNLFLSALPDRLSQSVEEKPEEFTLLVADYGIKFTYNIQSNYADDEFNGFSLLCHTNGHLIYKDNNVINKKKDECQW
eukprot:593856_1